MSPDRLRELALESFKELAPNGIINASSKAEVYGCLFGRDALLTALQVLDACQVPGYLNQSENRWLLSIVKNTLVKLVELQGKESNIESNEQPGKCIHEFRTEGHERLTQRPVNPEKRWENPWYVYPDGTLRNYDSIDATPLLLITLHRYLEATHDNTFLTQALPAAEAALNWIISYGDMDKDSLLEYEFHPQRQHGGLLVQSWADSHESLHQADGRLPKYPIKPVEVQGYAWLALKLWGDFYADRSPAFAQKLTSQAQAMKQQFNKSFIFNDPETDLYYAAQALDGDNQQIRTITADPLILLFASYTHPDKHVESIVEDQYIPDLVQRAFKEDLFDPKLGIRTMSTQSRTFNPNPDSYHNGPAWMKQNWEIYSGLRQRGYSDQAKKLAQAALKPLLHFGTPVELSNRDETGRYIRYKSNSGQEGCSIQAWTAGAVLDILGDLPTRGIGFSLRLPLFKILIPSLPSLRRVLPLPNPPTH